MTKEQRQAFIADLEKRLRITVDVQTIAQLTAEIKRQKELLQNEQ